MKPEEHSLCQTWHELYWENMIGTKNAQRSEKLRNHWYIIRLFWEGFSRFITISAEIWLKIHTCGTFHWENKRSKLKKKWKHVFVKARIWYKNKHWYYKTLEFNKTKKVCVVTSLIAYLNRSGNQSGKIESGGRVSWNRCTCFA